MRRVETGEISAPAFCLESPSKMNMYLKVVSCSSKYRRRSCFRWNRVALGTVVKTAGTLKTLDHFHVGVIADENTSHQDPLVIELISAFMNYLNINNHGDNHGLSSSD